MSREQDESGVPLVEEWSAHVLGGQVIFVTPSQRYRVSPATAKKLAALLYKRAMEAE